MESGRDALEKLSLEQIRKLAADRNSELQG